MVVSPALIAADKSLTAAAS